MELLLLVLRVLLIALLYGFLASVALMLWRDLRPNQNHDPTLFPKGRLVVIHTQEESLAIGTSFPLQPVTSMGRLASNTITITDAFSSAHHALLTWRAGQWWLEDRGSRNGTLLNGVAINVPTVVSGGDIIGVGQTQMKLETN
jgi:pSer/pThr/pTyr-binding forkhead associated (FHA) protein